MKSPGPKERELLFGQSCQRNRDLARKGKAGSKEASRQRNASCCKAGRNRRHLCEKFATGPIWPFSQPYAGLQNCASSMKRLTIAEKRALICLIAASKTHGFLGYRNNIGWQLVCFRYNLRDRFP